MRKMITAVVGFTITILTVLGCLYFSQASVVPINTTVGGGQNNSATGSYATVGGGYQNSAREWSATVGGGQDNQATGLWATVAGGQDNHANTMVMGASQVRQHHATVGGGKENHAEGAYATVPGGQKNRADGSHSFAAGFRANITSLHGGSFLFADASRNIPFPSANANEFAVRAAGGVRFVTGTDATGNLTAGVKLDRGSSSWASLSDRDAKANVAPVNAREVLQRLVAMPIQRWNYKSQDPSIRHIGPMAQDFYASFRLGGDDKYITTVDADGIALVAIQGLYRELQGKNAKIETQQRLMEILETRLERLEKLVSKQ